MKNEFRAGEALVAAANSFSLDLIAGFAQPSGVHKNDRNAADVRGFFNRVARRSRNWRNDGSLVTEQLVQETAFAGVWPPDNGCSNSAPQDLAFYSGTQQLIHKRDAAL